jgi:cytochrome c oxidase subunit 2
MDYSRRKLFFTSLAGLGMLLGVRPLKAQQGAKFDAQVVKVQAKRYVFVPDEIVLKKGEPVVLEFTSVDFVHGFKAPDFNIRADLTPGKVVRIGFTPEKTGTFDFLCDNFCGSGHEEMAGRFIVEA